MDHRDLTSSEQNSWVLSHASELLVQHGDDIDEHVRDITFAPDVVSKTAPAELEALRCAIARHRLGTIDDPVHLSIVWAMYGETTRIVPSSEHPHGEDFLREKVRQMEWLTNRLDVTWDVCAVDDGCPDDPPSGDVAESLIASEGWTNVRVERLADVLADADPVDQPFSALTSTDHSRKGGSIAYGLWKSVADPVGDPNRTHFVLYTDADLSANLAQVGSLAEIAHGGDDVVVGQRYGVSGSILVKQNGAMTEPSSTGGKPDKTIILFRNFVRSLLIPQLADVPDTQAGFKLFAATAARRAVGRLESFSETFDVELLVHAGAASVTPAPILFTEDFAASNFPSVDPQQRHLDMVVQIVNIQRRLIPDEHLSDEAIEMRKLIERMELDEYVALIHGLDDLDEYGADDPVLFDTTWTMDQIRELARA